jgi:cell division protein FtsL
MDTNQTLISTAISIGTYILYKVAQKYYVRSGCHNSTIEIVIVNKEAEKEEKEQELKDKDKEAV